MVFQIETHNNMRNCEDDNDLCYRRLKIRIDEFFPKID